jgi:hypothetical protein
MLTDTLSSGVTLSGLAPVSLEVGQSKSVTITLTPAASTPLNSMLDASITATYRPSAAAQTQSVTIPLQVPVPGAAAISGLPEKLRHAADDLRPQHRGLAGRRLRCARSTLDHASAWAVDARGHRDHDAQRDDHLDIGG